MALRRDDVRAWSVSWAREAGVVAVPFVLAAVVAAFIWDAAATIPKVILYQGLLIPPTAVEATKAPSMDVVYLLISLPLALILGAGLMFWRRRNPVQTVILLAFAGIIAAALMERFGLWLGPSNPTDALIGSNSTAPLLDTLHVQATGVLLVWPAAAVLGGLLVLLFASPSHFEPANGSDADTVPSEPVVAPGV